MFSQSQGYQSDSIIYYTGTESEIINLDSLLETKLNSNNLMNTSTTKSEIKPAARRNKNKSAKLSDEIGKQAFDSLLIVNQAAKDITPPEFTFSKSTTFIPIDSLVLKANPFFIELVFKELAYTFEYNSKPDFQSLYYGFKPKTINDNNLIITNYQTPVQFIESLRQGLRGEISRNAAHLYMFTFDELPDPTGVKNRFLVKKKLEKVQFVDNDEYSTDDKKLILRKEVVSPWLHSGAAIVQFSQNSVSNNWYQGGNSNLAVLGILAGKLNYDNKDNIQWDNNAEWRLGFNTVTGDTLRALSTNDDVLKINSKLGIKASGNWFYSGSVDFSTQFFNSYNGINSTEMKASFLTPVRLNIGVGFDYKYKKLFSFMFSPVAYKFIYVDDAVNVDPNLFGIDAGDNVLSEIGSSFKTIVSYPISHEIQLDSKLAFYTNYKKVEIDWEIVFNMSINRFMSTRISLNPRYDNTVIEAAGNKAQIQYKQLLSVGFSHKFK